MSKTKKHEDLSVPEEPGPASRFSKEQAVSLKS